MEEGITGSYILYKDGYRYQLARDYIVALPHAAGEIVETRYLALSNAGVLTIRAGYAWDGPSGPTIDTRDALRASLVHDACYQLIRLGYLPAAYREIADDLLYRLAVEDGMLKIRAWCWKQALRLFGGKNARPSREKPVLMAP